MNRSAQPAAPAEPAGVPHCANCRASLAAVPDAPYCPWCGQETQLTPPSLLEFVHEFLTHYGSARGTLMRTLALLLRRPGELTLEYLRGRRRHYVAPMRLYLSTSFAFFVSIRLVAALAGQAADEVPSAETAASAASAAAEQASAAASATDDSDTPETDTGVHFDFSDEDLTGSTPAVDCHKTAAGCTWQDRVKSQLKKRLKKLKANGENLSSYFLSSAPYAVFLMLPVFAGWMKLLYWGRRRSYGEHFVFSLHLHSFWFLALMALELLPASVSWLAALAIPVYGVMAMRRVHGGGRGATLVRAFVISGAHSLMLLLAVCIGAVFAAMAAS